MLTQTDAHIYLSGCRGLQQLEGFRSYRTLNSSLVAGSHSSHGNMYLLQDDTLAGGATCTMAVAMPSLIFLIPTVGKLEYRDQADHYQLVEAGCCQRIHVKAGAHFEIHNPYEQALINYLQVWFYEPMYNVSHYPLLADFDIDADRNKLILISGNKGNELPGIYLGKFKGRSEGLYTLKGKNSGLYCFVVEGAFEIAGRLLESRDGLALWNTDVVEFEALSNDAIVLMMEVSL